MVFDLFGEGLAVGEVPCLRIEAALAVVRASGDKEGVSDAGAVCDVVFFDVGVVHGYFLYWLVPFLLKIK